MISQANFRAVKFELLLRYTVPDNGSESHSYVIHNGENKHHWSRKASLLHYQCLMVQFFIFIISFAQGEKVSDVCTWKSPIMGYGLISSLGLEKNRRPTTSTQLTHHSDKYACVRSIKWSIIVSIICREAIEYKPPCVSNAGLLCFAQRQKEQKGTLEHIRPHRNRSALSSVLPHASIQTIGRDAMLKCGIPLLHQLDDIIFIVCA